MEHALDCYAVTLDGGSLYGTPEFRAAVHRGLQELEDMGADMSRVKQSVHRHTVGDRDKNLIFLSAPPVNKHSVCAPADLGGA